MGYYTKENYLKPGQKGYIKNVGDFAKVIYKIKNRLPQIDNDDRIYQAYLTAVEREHFENQGKKVYYYLNNND